MYQQRADTTRRAAVGRWVTPDVQYWSGINEPRRLLKNGKLSKPKITLDDPLPEPQYVPPKRTAKRPDANNLPHYGQTSYEAPHPGPARETPRPDVGASRVYVASYGAHIPDPSLADPKRLKKLHAAKTRHNDTVQAAYRKATRADKVIRHPER